MMKARWFIFLFLIGTVCCTYLINCDQVFMTEEKAPIDYLEEKLKPSDYWEDRWSYPSTESQAENYKIAVSLAKKANNSRVAGKSGLASNWRMEGPTNIGGRANCLMVDIRDANTIYAGMSAGGIFKTTDGGANWLPIADDFAYLSISQIVQDPKNPNTIYATTGDRNFGSWGRVGDGVKVSYDAGATWQSAGLSNAGIVSKLLVDTLNNVLWASVLGNPRIKSNLRGVYKSTDMGLSWQNVHFVSDSVGAIDMVMDPFDPQIIYVSYFNRMRTSLQSSASGNDGRVWQTKDGGITWSMLTNGLPNYPVSRIGLAISSHTPGKIYAIVVGSDFYHEGLYKSIDTGASWVKQQTLGLPSNYNGGFGWYFGQVRLNPYDDEEVWLPGVDMFTSSDGGATFSQTVPDWYTYQVHADKHDLVFSGANNILLATDGGLYRGTGVLANRNNWVDIDLIPNNQFYRVAINPHRNEVYAGGLQDNGTVEGFHTQIDNWTRIYGGDGFQMIYDPVDPNIYYCETQNGNLYAFDQANNYFNHDFDLGVNQKRNWDMPFIMSRFNRKKLYCLSDRVYQTTEGPYGSFSLIHSGALTKGISNFSNNQGSALCESKLDSNLLYAGTGDGKVWQVNVNNGTTLDISAGLPDRYVTSLTTSSNDSNLVVVTHSGYLDFQNTPHIHLSTDRGFNWVSINGDLPPFALNDAEILDNTNDSVIFVASDVGVYVTFNRGNTWSRIGGNMPMIPVNDIAIDYSANRLIAGTFARSMQSFDIDSIITINPKITIALGNDTTLCKGDTIILGSHLMLDNYTWSTGATTPTIKVFKQGSVWLETQTATGVVRDSITISMYNSVSEFFLGDDTSICAGSSLSLGGNVPVFDSYLWNTGSTSRVISIQDSGTYILEARNKCDTLSDTIKINYLLPDSAVIEAIKINDFDEIQFKNASERFFSSNWFLDGSLISTLNSFSYQFKTEGTYTITLESTDSNGCVNNDSLAIQIASSDYFIPTVFTPNRDGINDFFSPQGKSISHYLLTIYNKWGVKVIELENIPWNGRNIGGRPVESGTYFYKIKLKFSSGEASNQTGVINLMR